MADENLQSNSEEDKYANLSKEQLVDLLRGFQELVKSPEGKKSFLKKATETQSEEIRRRKASFPYYKERFGKEIQATVDLMLADGKNRIFRYEDFPHTSRNSLYIRIHQGFLYLIDVLDDTPDQKYIKARDIIIVRKTREGILLDITKALAPPKILSTPIDPLKSKREWKTEAQEFIENGKVNTKLHIKDINLSEEEIEEVKLMIFGMEDQFMSKISGTEIILLKIDPNNPPKL